MFRELSIINLSSRADILLEKDAFAILFLQLPSQFKQLAFGRLAWRRLLNHVEPSHFSSFFSTLGHKLHGEQWSLILRPAWTNRQSAEGNCHSFAAVLFALQTDLEFVRCFTLTSEKLNVSLPTKRLAAKYRSLTLRFFLVLNALVYIIMLISMDWQFNFTKYDGF